MADLLGLDRSTYSYYELGKIKPDIKAIMRLAKIFKVHYTDILESEGENEFRDTSVPILRSEESSSTPQMESLALDNITPREREVIMVFRMLSKRSQKDAEKFMGERLSSENKKD